MKLKNHIYRFWNRLKLLRRNFAALLISSKFVLFQILGAIASTRCTLIFIACLISYYSVESFLPDLVSKYEPECALSLLTLILFEIVFIVKKLSPIFSLRRQELSITWSQICILLAFLGWLISALVITGLDHKNDLLTIAIAGSILTWVFQDTVKNVVAFLYLRLNNLLHIGDWIIVDSRRIDGVVKFVNLTTVTIENWDTTTSSFPIFILYSEPFKNLQAMLDHKTHGRRMFLSLVLDSGWVQPVTLSEAETIVKKLETDRHFKDRILQEVHEAVNNDKEILNLSLFRRYVHHWLMNNKKFSRAPRLIVRYLEPTECGIPMQIYGYIVDVSLESFEWVQSQTIEHLLQVMSYFNLRLYQSPSGFDASNANIYLAPESTPYKIKNIQ